MSAVEVEGLSRKFGETVALDGLSFEVADGELFGFIGPDGAGKTTLFRILTTLLKPDAGSARVLGMDPVRDLWALRARLGYMPGRFSLYPDLSVEENLGFFASVFGTTVEAQYALIAPIYDQIAPFKDRRAGALSGGMKQKLALCCALVHRPDILFLDEPTTGVDAVSRREFWDLLHDLRAGGLTIVVSTPYMDEADRCDRVALIQKGKILEIDAPGAIGGRYEWPLVAVAARDRRRLIAALRAEPDAYSVYPFGEEVHFTDRRVDADPGHIARTLQERLRAAGLDDARARPIRAGIEDVFMARMAAESP
jgi:ABC-type multidrug transport system ATPase subunit